jgi:hypothetical protein
MKTVGYKRRLAAILSADVAGFDTIGFHAVHLLPEFCTGRRDSESRRQG